MVLVLLASVACSKPVEPTPIENRRDESPAPEATPSAGEILAQAFDALRSGNRTRSAELAATAEHMSPSEAGAELVAALADAAKSAHAKSQLPELAWSAPVHEAGEAHVVATLANVRSSGSATSRLLGYAHFGQPVQVLDVQGDFAEVELGSLVESRRVFVFEWEEADVSPAPRGFIATKLLARGALDRERLVNLAETAEREGRLDEALSGYIRLAWLEAESVRAQRRVLDVAIKARRPAIAVDAAREIERLNAHGAAFTLTVDYGAHRARALLERTFPKPGHIAIRFENTTSAPVRVDALTVFVAQQDIHGSDDGYARGELVLESRELPRLTLAPRAALDVLVPREEEVAANGTYRVNDAEDTIGVIGAVVVRDGQTIDDAVREILTADFAMRLMRETKTAESRGSLYVIPGAYCSCGD